MWEGGRRRASESKRSSDGRGGRTRTELPPPFAYTALALPPPLPPPNLLHYLVRSDVNRPIITSVLPPLRLTVCRVRRFEDQ